MKLLFVFTASAHGSVNAQEGLDALLMGSAFTECGVLFLNDGALQLINHQNTEALGTKEFSRGFAALADYGVQQVMVVAEDMTRLGLSAEDLLIPVELITSAAIAETLNSYDRVLNF